MKKVLSVLTAFIVLLSCTVFTLPALAVTSYDVTADYTGNVKIGSASCAANNGIVDHYPYATAEKVTIDGISALKVTPDPTYNQSKVIALDQYSYGALGIDLTSLKYIQLYVKYTGTTQLGKAKLNFMQQYKKDLVRNCPCESIETMTTGWQWLTFNVADALYGSINSGGILSQFHYYVYGEIPVQQLKAADVMYVAKIRFVSQSSAGSSGISRRYPVYFSKGRADVEGTELDPVYVTPGSSVTLPQCPYTRENYTFRGWVNGADLQLYQPGDRVTINERNLNPSLTTARTYFIADWTYTAPDSLDPERLTVDFGSNYNALLGNKDYATVTKNFKFKGRNTLKVAIDNTKNYPLNLDSWELTKIPFDIDKYKYATVTYYYESTDPISATPRIRLLPSGGALTGEYYVNSATPLESNKWSVMCFNLTGADAKKAAGVSPHIIKQIHWQLSGDKKNVTEFGDGDVIYLDKITLYKETPYRTPKVQISLFEGLEDGNFHPGSPLKRSEAAELFVNVMGNKLSLSFSSVTPCTQTDVPSSASCKKAVDVLEYYHIIPGGTAFRPGDSITRHEFTEWIVRTLIVLGGRNVVPTELAFSADNSLLTRAQAAYFINRLLLDDDSAVLSTDVIPFPDVTKDTWFYSDIVKLCSERLSYTDASGEEIWVFPFYGESNFDITAGDAYVALLDGQEEQRIEEIRSTGSACAPLKDGRTFYVTSDSAYGRTSNDGLSESSARLISSLSGVSGLGARKGDVVLFRRGDIFRGSFSTVSGVTYSAYGEGEKPKFYRSEKNYTGASNWTLDYTNSSTGAKIWKYNSAVTNDVGCIVCNDGEVVGLKEIPDYTGGKYYVRGSGAATEFDYKVQLNSNHEFFHKISDGSATGSGYVYFRCDEGNPGQLFADIEFNQRGNCIGGQSNVTIDNICIKYFGSHGIGAGSVTNLTVTNCEIGWGGGSIQHYTNGVVTRFGNGVEIYGGLVNYTIDNCRVYQIYDAGITHQISSSSSGNYYMENVRYTNNVLTDCTYNIEYFMSSPTSGTYERLMKDVLFENNIIRRSGYGWGVQRPDQAPSGIKGWTHNNTAINFTVRNNIIDRCYNISGNTAPIMQLGASYEGCTAYLEGNTFVQVPGRTFAFIGQTSYTHDENLSYTLAKLGGKDNVYYFASN